MLASVIAIFLHRPLNTGQDTWPCGHLHICIIHVLLLSTKKALPFYCGARWPLTSGMTPLIHSPQFSKRAWWDPVRITIYLPLVYSKLTSLAPCPSLINEAGHKHIAKGQQGFALRTMQWSILEGLEESLKLETALKTPHGEVKGWNGYEDRNMLQARSGIHTECHSIIAIVNHIWVPVILYSSQRLF